MRRRASGAMTEPNFIIIGVPKSGTTSLYHYCRQHPQIFMSRLKEPRFFIYDGVDPGYGGPGAAEAYRNAIRDYDRYRALFAGARDERVVGEATGGYFYAPQACARIRARLPDAKLIAVLRQPVDRSYSDYQQRVLLRIESAPSFSAAWADHDRRRRENWFFGTYRFRSTYYPHLKRYLDAFGPDRFKIFLFEDLIQRPDDMIRSIWRFLEVDDTVRPDLTRRYNDGNILENPVVRALWNGTAPLRKLITPVLPVWARGYAFNALASVAAKRGKAKPLPPEERDALTESCREDIQRVQDLIGRDLSAWLAPTPRLATR